MRPLLLLLLAGLPLLGLAAVNRPDPNSFMPKSKPKAYDLNALRAEVDESQALFDNLARETRGLSKTAKADLLTALGRDFNLPTKRDRAASLLEDAEAMLEARAKVEAQEKAASAAVADEERRSAREELASLKEALAGRIESLRDGLREVHKNYGEEEVRNLRNWAMVSQGSLERARLKGEPTLAPTPGPASAQPRAFRRPPSQPAQLKR